MVKKLVQTKSAFKVIGKVTRIDKDGAYKEDTAKKGKREGETFRSLRFGVKTSDNNEITVSMFDYEPNEVFLWNSEKRKEDENYKGEKIPFGTWLDQEDELREAGYAVLQSRIGLVHNEEGKLQSKGVPSFVASQEIYNQLNNGDFVVVEGEIRYNSYENNEGKTVTNTNYTIKKVFRVKDVDFEDEKFEEISYFEQDLVYVDSDIDKKEGKMYITGRTIDFAGNFIDTQYIVNFKDSEGNIDSDMVKLVDAIKKNCKFGDVLSVYGDAWNKVLLGQAEEEEEDSGEDDLFKQFGGRQKPKHAQQYVAKKYVTEMSILGVDGLKSGEYTEEDFIKDELIESNEDNPFGGKPKKDKNPFASGGEEITEDDLPF